MVEHVVFIKTHSAPLEWTDNLRRIVGDPVPVLKEDAMFYVGVPAFLPFTHALLAMSHLPIEIVDISGHEALQVKVSCPPSTGKVFESDMKSHCVPGSRILFRFQYPKGSLDDRWHFSVGIPASLLYVPLFKRRYLFHSTFWTGSRRCRIFARIFTICEYSALLTLAQSRNRSGNATA
jgi:hypothetical protein